MKLTPGKLYKCINASQNDGSPHFGNPCEYIVDNGDIASYHCLKVNDIIMFIEDVWVPNVNLYKFLLNNKIILMSSYFDNWFDSIFMEL